MSDLVVTIPMRVWSEWLAEGDCAGDPPSGAAYVYWCGPSKPPIEPGERLYIVAHRWVRGYAPVKCITRGDSGRYGIVREGGAVAVTIPENVQGFRGFRRRWWKHEDEKPFGGWKFIGVV